MVVLLYCFLFDFVLNKYESSINYYHSQLNVMGDNVGEYILYIFGLNKY